MAEYPKYKSTRGFFTILTSHPVEYAQAPLPKLTLHFNSTSLTWKSYVLRHRTNLVSRLEDLLEVEGILRHVEGRAAEVVAEGRLLVQAHLQLTGVGRRDPWLVGIQCILSCADVH